MHGALVGVGVRMLLHEDESSSVLRTYLLPDHVGYADAHDHLKDAGFVIYAGQGNLAPDVFRVAFMGDITTADMDALCRTLTSTFGRGMR